MKTRTKKDLQAKALRLVAKLPTTIKAPTPEERHEMAIRGMVKVDVEAQIEEAIENGEWDS